MRKTTFRLQGVEQRNAEFRPIVALIVTDAWGESYVGSELIPGVGFSTETEALDAGDRIIKAVELTGAFPNMCEPF